MNQKLWLRQVIILVSVLVIMYSILHLIFHDGRRLISLNPTQLSDIGTLINNDTLRDKNATINKIDKYLKNTIETPVISNLFEILKPYSPNEYIIVLTSTKIKLSSFFWLTGKLQAVEIVFWSVFGVLASLLYTGSEAMRHSDFNSKEVAVHIAKLFYAPLCTIVIILSINALTSNGDVSIEQFQYWLIVLSFILGFFSGRTIELLNKIKDLILPLGKVSESSKEEKIEIEGKISLSPTIQAGTNIDITKTAVKIFSMNDPSSNDIGNPNADGSFLFSGLKTGDYVIKAEYKNGADVLEARKSIKLPLANKEEVIDLSLIKTN
jgi:hypothetical protein